MTTIHWVPYAIYKTCAKCHPQQKSLLEYVLSFPKTGEPEAVPEPRREIRNDCSFYFDRVHWFELQRPLRVELSDKLIGYFAALTP